MENNDNAKNNMDGNLYQIQILGEIDQTRAAWFAKIGLRAEQILNGDVYRNRNFGEDVWKRVRENRHVSVSLEDVDASIDLFNVSARTKSHVGRSVDLILTKAATHNLKCELHVREQMK